MIKRVLLLLSSALALAAAWFTKPWDDLQSWRLYTIIGESNRAALFSRWEVIQPQAHLPGALVPREYPRKTVDPSTVYYEYEGQRYALTHYFQRANVTGFMVMAGGEVLVEYYDQGFTPETRSHIWSASKSYTSTLVGMALHDGAIDSLDDLVLKYAPQFSGSEYGSTSIRHVMMMSSGIDFFHFKGKPDRRSMYWAILQEGQDFDVWSGELGRRVPAGTDFNYIATDTHVLSAVLRGAYGEPFPDIVQRKLWAPGGFAAATWGLDHYGHAMGHCCLSVRLQDFANLGQLHLENLVIDGRSTVNPDWIEMVENAQAPFQEPQYVENEDGERRLQEGYSFQWWLPLDYDQEFIAKGAFGQYLWVDRKRGFVVAQFSTGQPTIGTKLDIKEEEFAAVARAMKQVGQ